MMGVVTITINTESGGADMYKVLVSSRAAIDYSGDCFKGAGPLATLSYDQWTFRYVLEKMQGEWFPVLKDIVGGVKDCTYLLINFDRAGDRFLRSKVVAVPNEYIVMEDPGDGTFAETPIEENENWKQDGFDIVRLIVPWVDGFMAFAPRKGGNHVQ
jgi:hypothetical protein